MGRFLKDNSYTIVKMVVFQIGMTMFGLIVSMATTSSTTLSALASVLAIAMYLYLLYTAVWDEGAKDKIRSDSGRMILKPLNGLYMSLAANVINFILGIGVLVGGIGMGGSSLDILLKATPQWAYELYTSCKLIGLFLQGMYAGLLSNYAPYNMFAYLLIVIPAPITCMIGYYMGTKEKTFLPRKKTVNKK